MTEAIHIESIILIRSLRVHSKFIHPYIDPFDKEYLSSQVSFARPSSEAIKGANLYVSGLPKHMAQPDLERMFASCGNIITSRILCDNMSGASQDTEEGKNHF